LLKSNDDYSRMMLDHKYCLAPHGKGTASIRLFEAISHHTVPIVLSDEYVHPRVPDWSEGVVTLPQRKPRDVIRLENDLSECFSKRQSVVRKFSEDYFGPASRWNFYGDQLQELLNQGGKWTVRSYGEYCKSNLHWLQHRLSKKLEGILV
jgi:hypothetical protein